VWHPYIELLSDSKPLQMVYNNLETRAQLLTDATAATTTTGLPERGASSTTSTPERKR